MDTLAIASTPSEVLIALLGELWANVPLALCVAGIAALAVFFYVTSGE